LKRGGPRLPLGLIALLSTGLLINYVDRGSIATAAPLLEKQFSLSAGQMGWVLSAFFWAYVPSQPLMGWFADRLGAARVLACGFALWSIATVLTGLSAGLAMLVGLRLVMGVGESVFYPCALSLLARHVTDRHRGRATATMQFGALIGPALGTFVGGWVMVHYGWRTMFIALGIVSMFWLIPWLRVARAGRAPQTSSLSSTGPALSDILRQRALWGAMLGIFCSNYAFYFVFTWLPLYLVQDRGLSLVDMTHWSSAFYLVDGASVLLTGWALDTWIGRGASTNRAYKTALALSALGVGLSLLACTVAGLTAAGILLLATGLMDGMNSPATCAATQVFAGPEASGRWMGLQNAVANVAGIIAPVVTGYLVQATHHYTAALGVAGAVALVGVAAWLWVTPAVRPVNWGAQRPIRLL
jgi:MFS family permease